MHKQLIATWLFLFTLLAAAQPSTEVFLFDISDDLTLSNPVNVSANKGYDNQPSFTENGELLYTSFRKGNTDLMKYDITSGKRIYLTETPAGEYSPTQMPSGESLSTITLEQNGRQLLWKYPLAKAGKGEELVPFLKIGYHTWLNEDELFAFVLGPHPTLQWIKLSTLRSEIIAEDIGRSLHIVPNTSLLSYVKKMDDQWVIRQYNPKTDAAVDLTTTQPEVEDMCWYDENTLLMGKGSTLYSWTAGEGWKQVADLSDWELTGITRMAVSRDQKKLAIVVNDPK